MHKNLVPKLLSLMKTTVCPWQVQVQVFWTVTPCGVMLW